MVDYLHSKVIVRKKLISSSIWVEEADGIELIDTHQEKASLNMGKTRDTFSLNVRNPKNSLYEQKFSGDGIDKSIELKWKKVDNEHLSGAFQKMFVYVNDELQEYGIDYVFLEGLIGFIIAPPVGILNIRVSFPVIEADDLIDMYIWKNKDFDLLTTQEKDEARVIEGVISTLSISKGSINSLSINGYGLIDVIFSGMAFALFDITQINKSHLAIQQIISQLNKYNPNRRIYGQDESEWTALGNDRSDKIISYNSKYVTAVEMIEDLSEDKYTGNGQFIFWVDYVTNINGQPRYAFRWKEKPTDSSDLITEGIDPSNIKIGKSTEDVTNVVIYNAGNDCYGHGQEYINYDFTIAGHGGKWKYVSSTSTIFQNLLNAEVTSSIGEWLLGDDNEPTSNFPIAYPYTIKNFHERDKFGDNLGTTIIVNSDSQFNKAMRNESKWSGNEKTDFYIRRFSQPRYKCTLMIPRTIDKKYKLGDIITIDLPCFAVNNIPLRIMDITHELKQVQYTIEEDEETIVK